MKAESEKATREAMSALGAQARSGGLPRPHSGVATETSDSSASGSDSSTDERRAARHHRHHHRSSSGKQRGGGGSSATRDLESRIHYLTVDLTSTKGELSDAQTALDAATAPTAVFKAADALLAEYGKAADAVATARTAAAPRGTCACLRTSTMTAANADAHGTRLNEAAAAARAAVAKLPAGKIREYVTRVLTKNDKDAGKSVAALHADVACAARWSCTRAWIVYAAAAAVGAVVMALLLK